MYSSIYRIQKQNYYLWGLLITVILIVLLELGKFPDSLIGQGEPQQNYIQLSKGNEIRSIPTGSWVAVIQKDVPHPMIGILRGKIDNNLLIENPKTNDGELIPYSEIEIFYHGEAKRIGHYALKGMKYGALTAFLYGSGWTVFMAMDDSIEYAPLAYMCGAAVFIPSGVLLGYLQGLSKNKRATEYIFATGWEIL